VASAPPTRTIYKTPSSLLRLAPPGPCGFSAPTLIPTMIIGATQFRILYFALFLGFLFLYPGVIQRYTKHSPIYSESYLLGVPSRNSSSPEQPGGDMERCTVTRAKEYRLKPARSTPYENACCDRISTAKASNFVHPPSLGQRQSAGFPPEARGGFVSGLAWARRAELDTYSSHSLGILWKEGKGEEGRI